MNHLGFSNGNLQLGSNQATRKILAEAVGHLLLTLIE